MKRDRTKRFRGWNGSHQTTFWSIKIPPGWVRLKGESEGCNKKNNNLEWIWIFYRDGTFDEMESDSDDIRFQIDTTNLTSDVGERKKISWKMADSFSIDIKGSWKKKKKNNVSSLYMIQDEWDLLICGIDVSKNFNRLTLNIGTIISLMNVLI